MMRRTRSATVGATVVAAACLSVAVSGSAHAAKPGHAGPPEKTSPPLTQNAPAFHCDDRRISVTGGRFSDRTRLLPHGRSLSHTVGLGGVGVDEQGEVYKIRVTGRFTGSETEFDGRLRVVLIGAGDVHRVRLLFSTEEVQVTGDCTVVFPEPPA